SGVPLAALGAVVVLMPQPTSASISSAVTEYEVSSPRLVRLERTMHVKTIHIPLLRLAHVQLLVRVSATHFYRCYARDDANCQRVPPVLHYAFRQSVLQGLTARTARRANAPPASLSV